MLSKRWFEENILKLSEFEAKFAKIKKIFLKVWEKVKETVGKIFMKFYVIKFRIKFEKN